MKKNVNTSLFIWAIMIFLFWSAIFIPTVVAYNRTNVFIWRANAMAVGQLERDVNDHFT